MSHAKQAKLAETPAGRCWLHAVAGCRDKRVRWHMRGISRELRAVIREAAESARQVVEGVRP